MDEREEDEDDDGAIGCLFLPPNPSRPGSALSEGSPSPAQAELDLLEMCRRAAAKISADWPSCAPAVKQLIPAVPTCVSEMKRFWDKPFSHRVLLKGFSRLDVNCQMTMQTQSAGTKNTVHLVNLKFKKSKKQ